MLIVSSRKNFIDTDKMHHGHDHSLEHLYKNIDLSKIFADDDEAYLSEDDFFTQLNGKVDGKNILVLIHGFNSRHDKVFSSYQMIEKNMHKYCTGHYDYIIGYLWPGGDHWWEWWCVRRHVHKSVARFQDFIQTLSAGMVSAGTNQIDINSHSLGAHVVLAAMDGMTKPVIRNYFCKAAAVNDNVLDPDEQFHSVKNNAGMIFIFHSRRDVILKISYFLARLFCIALGFAGAKNKRYINREQQKTIYEIDCEKVIANHNAYKTTPIIYQHTNKILNGIEPSKKVTTLIKN